MTNTDTAFPVAIDTRAAATDGELLTLFAEEDRLIARAHVEAGDTKVRRGHREAWTMTREEAIDGASAETRTAIETNDYAQRENRTRAAALQTVWETHGRWERYFLVTSSDGHIHANTYCSHRGRTEYGWQPELSGRPAQEAVAALGPRMCTKCFPEAPAEWSAGVVPEGTCTGSGERPVAGSVNRRYRTPFGECPTCHTNQTVKLDGSIARHKTPLTPEQEAAKKERSKRQAKVTKEEGEVTRLEKAAPRHAERIENLNGYLARAKERGDTTYAETLRADIVRVQNEAARDEKALPRAVARLERARAALTELDA